MKDINLVFWVWMVVVLSFQVLRAILIHVLKTKHEDIYVLLGRPAPIGRDIFFVFDINRTNGCEILSKKTRWLIRVMKVLAGIGASMIVIFICLLTK